MRKYSILLTALVLTAALLTGCGCTPQKDTMPTVPTRATTPTTPATVAPTMPMTEPTEQATILPTNIPEPTTDATGGAADAPTGDITDSTGPSTGNSTRGRRTR